MVRVDDSPTECELMWARFAALRKGSKLRIRSKKEKFAMNP
jgi:hypothetical protein